MIRGEFAHLSELFNRAILKKVGHQSFTYDGERNLVLVYEDGQKKELTLSALGVDARLGDEYREITSRLCSLRS